MKDFDGRKLGILLSGIGIIVAVIVALVLVPPYAFIEKVRIEGEVPISIEKIARRMPGLSRMGGRYRELRGEIEDSIYFENVDFSSKNGELTITPELSENLMVITDGNGYILSCEDKCFAPQQEDIAFLRMHAPVLEVTSGQLEYIERFGIEKRLSEVIDLILDIYHSSRYNDKLVGKVKYQSGTGEEFGHLDLITASGDAVLHIREKLDPEMILKSLSVMKEKSGVLPVKEMREYELRGNTLTEQKRIVDGI